MPAKRARTPTQFFVKNSPNAQELDRVLLKEQAYERVKELIQTGVFPPQSALSERQLASRLGMSKTPIRVALENLERQGLVTVAPQRGILVRELSAREIGELFDVRLAVEPFAISQLAARGLTTEERKQLKENLADQLKAVKNEDAIASTHLDVAFHRLLAQILDNQEIIQWLERCFDRLHRSILRINRLVPGRLSKSYQDHSEMVAAIIDPSHKDVPTLMREHLNYGRQFLLSR